MDKKSINRKDAKDAKEEQQRRKTEKDELTRLMEKMVDHEETTLIV